MNSNELTKEQKGILHHTKWNAVNKHFYGEFSDDMKALCEAGLMRRVGRSQISPDVIFTITTKGAIEIEGYSP